MIASIAMKDEIRCSIIGNAGGGKSTLSRSLASGCDIPLHELDTYLWEEDLQPVSSDIFAEKHNCIISEVRWVIDGLGLPETLQPRIDRSTHIVYVDLPIWLYFALAAARQCTWNNGELKHPPGGICVPPPTKYLFELMWKIHTDHSPKIREIVDSAKCRGAKVEIVNSTDRLRELQFNPALIVS